MTVPTPQAAQLQLLRRMTILRRIVWVTGLLVALYWLAGMLRGMPESYHNQRTRGLSIALYLFFSSILGETRSPKIKFALGGLSIAALAATIWYMI